MPDVCTLVVATTMTLQACWSENKCEMTSDYRIKVCSGRHQITCPKNEPYYECETFDGKKYTLTQDQLNSHNELPK